MWTHMVLAPFQKEREELPCSRSSSLERFRSSSSSRLEPDPETDVPADTHSDAHVARLDDTHAGTLDDDPVGDPDAPLAVARDRSDPDPLHAGRVVARVLDP